MYTSKGSRRLNGYNYGNDGVYFVTLCVEDMRCLLGEVQEQKMILSPAGKVLEEEWLKTSEIRKTQKVRLDEFCVMPNHFHALIWIGEPQLPTKDNRLPTTTQNSNQFGPQRNNLSSMVRGFKAVCTNRIRQLGIENFKWQSRFYDHVVRDLSSLENIRIYIKNNPENWEKDRFFESRHL